MLNINDHEELPMNGDLLLYVFPLITHTGVGLEWFSHEQSTKVLHKIVF